MSFDIEELLAEVSAEQPCGTDLEYDPEFMALEQSARGKAQRQIGDTIIPAEEPEWDKVSQQAEALFSRTKDIRITLIFIRARIHLDQLPGLCSGLSLLVQLLKRYWEAIYPQLDAEDDNDPTLRMNALAPLADFDTTLKDIRNAYLVRASYGRITVRDILVAAGRWPSQDGELSPAELEGILQTAQNNQALPLETIQTGYEALTTLQAFLTEQVGVERTPNLSPLQDIFKTLVHFCNKVVAATGEVPSLSSEKETLQSVEVSASSVRPVALVPHEITTRQDALRLLDKVCEFLQRTEPTNPAPLFIRRAQQLMTKSFVEIIEDLAPDSLSDIQKMAGIKREDD